MARKILKHLTDGEIEIMHVIWAKPEGCTVKEVHKTINTTRKVALTTVASMVQVMEGKGICKIVDQNRPFRYLPLIKIDEARARLLGHAAEVLFSDLDEFKSYVKKMK